MKKNMTVDTSKVLGILVNSLYMNKILIPMQEIIYNAIDIHNKINSTAKIDIHLPTKSECFLSIRDYGTGLSELDMELYTQCGFSNKNKDLLQSGTYGIGSKSPFAYTDSYVVNSYFNNIKYIYNCELVKEDTNFDISYTLEEKIETLSPNGLEIIIPISETDIDQFIKYFEKVYLFNKDRLNITNQNQILFSMNFNNFEKNTYKISENLSILNKNFAPSFIKTSNQSISLCFVINNLIYECPKFYSDILKKEDYYIKEGIILIRVPNKYLTIAANREMLEESSEEMPKYKELFLQYMQTIVHFKKEIKEDIEHSSMERWLERKNELFFLSDDDFLGSYSFNYNDEKLPHIFQNASYSSNKTINLFVPFIGNLSFQLISLSKKSISINSISTSNLGRFSLLYPKNINQYVFISDLHDSPKKLKMKFKKVLESLNLSSIYIIDPDLSYSICEINKLESHFITDDERSRLNNFIDFHKIKKISELIPKNESQTPKKMTNVDKTFYIYDDYYSYYKICSYQTNLDKDTFFINIPIKMSGKNPVLKDLALEKLNNTKTNSLILKISMFVKSLKNKNQYLLPEEHKNKNFQLILTTDQQRKNLQSLENIYDITNFLLILNFNNSIYDQFIYLKTLFPNIKSSYSLMLNIPYAFEFMEILRLYEKNPLIFPIKIQETLNNLKILYEYYRLDKASDNQLNPIIGEYDQIILSKLNKKYETILPKNLEEYLPSINQLFDLYPLLKLINKENFNFEKELTLLLKTYENKNA